MQFDGTLFPQDETESKNQEKINSTTWNKQINKSN